MNNHSLIIIVSYRHIGLMVAMRDKKNIRNLNRLKSEIKINVIIGLGIQNLNKREVLKKNNIHQTHPIEKSNPLLKILEIKK